MSYLRGQPVKVERALAIVLGLGRSLKAAHGVKLVHGDLRPANILLTDLKGPSIHAGRAVLLWHSLYRLRSPVSVDSSPQYLMYRPPQDLIGEGRLAHMGTDIFALGAILYECLSGRPAFAGRHGNAQGEYLIESILENLTLGPPKLEARPETGLSAELAALFDEIIGTACAPDEQKRAPSMDVLVGMIEEVARLQQRPIEDKVRWTLPGGPLRRGLPLWKGCSLPQWGRCSLPLRRPSLPPSQSHLP